MSAVTASHPTQATFRRRRLGVLLLLIAVVLLVGAALGTVSAQAELDDPVAGHAVIEPGETLWDVARASAPEGVDPRAQLEAIRELNGIGGGDLAPWTVVLLPTR